MADTTRRYPHALITMVDTRQRDEIKTYADAVNRSISDVVRQAIAAGLPVLRQRAEEDGTLVA